MAKQPGRRHSARPQSLLIAAYVLLAAGVVLIATAMASTATRLEAASDGLLLIGWPLFILGLMLKGLDWMSSYTATSEGTWPHRSGRLPARGDEGAAPSRRRAKRPRLFGARGRVSGFEASAPELAAEQRPPALERTAPLPAVVPPARAPARSPEETTAPRVPAAVPSRPAPVAESVPEPQRASEGAPKGAPEREPEPTAEEEPVDLGRADPGPDTVIEEFVGYEGQDRMLAAREAPAPVPAAAPVPKPPPRELAWPHPPRQAEDVSAAGSGAFLGKLMDDVMAKLDTADGAGRVSAAAAAAAAVTAATTSATSATSSTSSTSASSGTSATSVTSAAAASSAGSASARPVEMTAHSSEPPAVAPIAWSRQVLHNADHWRFAALVEKLYQQAGFATQLQAGQTMRGVVVLWLFSRHRPGMPASVVSCVHAPGARLATEEIVALAELVKERGLSRGQLATTGDVDEATRQLAAARSVHLMDTERLLQLINQRSTEQQRILADRLA